MTEPQVPLALAAQMLRATYRTTLDWALCGKLVATRGPTGRWTVTLASIERLKQERRTALSAPFR
jgi:hypothetical protein